MIRDRFEVVINAIKTGEPIANPRSRFEEVINALVGAGGSDVTVTPIQTDGLNIATVTVDGVDSEIYAPSVTVTPVQLTGTKIAEIEIDDAGYDIYAPSSGGFQVITESTDHLNYNSPVTVAAGAFNSDNTLVFNILNNTMSYSMYIHARAVLAGPFNIGVSGQSNLWYQITYADNTFTVTNCSTAAPDITEIGVI